MTVTTTIIGFKSTKSGFFLLILICIFWYSVCYKKKYFYESIEKSTLKSEKQEVLNFLEENKISETSESQSSEISKSPEITDETSNSDVLEEIIETEEIIKTIIKETLKEETLKEEPLRGERSKEGNQTSPENLLEPEAKGWPRNRSRNVLDYINFEADTAILKPLNFNQPCKADSFIWAFVISSPANAERRSAIRKTWGKGFDYTRFNQLHQIIGSANDTDSARYEVRLTFLVGKTTDEKTQEILVRESNVYGDILQENFTDSYEELPLKSVFMLKWAVLNECVKKCNKVVHFRQSLISNHFTGSFVVKVDDDVFLNIPNLVHYLRGGTIPGTSVALSSSQLEHLILGYVVSYGQVLRNPNIKL